MKIKIGVAYHKQSPIISNDIYIPIQVGKAVNPSLDLQIQPDNVGDNISIENGYYCELTATYWMWKNVDADYKGICHYRRCFSFKFTVFDAIRVWLSALHNKIYVPQKRYNDSHNFIANVLDESEGFLNIINDYSIIAPRKIYALHTVYSHFSIIGDDYIKILKQVVIEKYPNVYDYLERTLDSHSFYYANMIVMRTDYFNDYCEFLFDTLTSVKQRMLDDCWIYSTKEQIFSRKLGYLAEILTSTYLMIQENKNTPIKQMVVSMMK